MKKILKSYLCFSPRKYNIIFPIVEFLAVVIIGLFVGLVSKGIVSPEIKLLLVTGFCGGFTTFSTFANESFSMMKAGDALQMALYLAASVVIGILAVWLGMDVSDTIK